MNKDSYDLYRLGFISKSEYELGSRNYYDGCTSCSYTPCGVGLQQLVGFKHSTHTTQTEPTYTEMLIGSDGLDIMSGHITHGKSYEVVDYDGAQYKVVDDKGVIRKYHQSWFTPVKLYDEDETKLTCRDIDFNVEDYIDLRKHTPDQIRHIAKFYSVFELEEILEEWTRYLVFEVGGFKPCGLLKGAYTFDGEEYTYNDIFYLEE